MTVILIILKLKFLDETCIYIKLYSIFKNSCYMQNIFEFTSSFFKMALSLSFVELLLVLESDRFFRFIFIDEISTRDETKMKESGKGEKKGRVYRFAGYRFRCGETTPGNDERPCVPLEDKSFIFPRYSSPVIYFDSVLLLLFII